MDKLRVGMIIEENCLPTEGGGYSYYHTLLNAINHHSFHPEIEMVNIVFSKKIGQRCPFKKEVLVVRKDFFSAVSYFFFHLMFRLWYRILRPGQRTLGEFFAKKMDTIKNRSAIAVLEENNIDLIYYLKPHEHTIDYPLIITHWDVGHKSMYPFPEVAWNGNFKKREDYYLNVLNKAFLILCESEAGRNELLRFYNINHDKVKVLPTFSGKVLNQHVSLEHQMEILLKFKLKPFRFYLYPAQFWAHKNHYNLIYAFQALLQEPGNNDLKLVLCGSDQGNLVYITRLIRALQLQENVVFPGFISDEELYSMYKNSVALVMPTFLGPTNLPLIEAATLSCPIVCSKLEGHFEILGETALYFDPASATAIKDRMLEILNAELRNKLVTAAQQRISQSSFNIEKSTRLLENILLQIKPIRKTWGKSAELIFQILTLPTFLMQY